MFMGGFLVLMGAEAGTHDGIKPAQKGALHVEGSSGLCEFIGFFHD